MPEMQELTNGKKDWLRWTNTVLLILVGALLGLYIKSNDERITRLEDQVARQERVVKLEEEVRRIALEQASKTSRFDSRFEFIEIEIARLRKHAER